MTVKEGRRMKSDREEAGIRWWLRYIIVPLVGGGGLVAIIVALMNRSTLTADPTSGYYWTQKFAQEKVLVVYGRGCNDPNNEEKLQCNESSLGVRVVKAQKQLGGRLLEHKNVPELGYGIGHTVELSPDRGTLTWRGGRGGCDDDFEAEMFVELYECVKAEE